MFCKLLVTLLCIMLGEITSSVPHNREASNFHSTCLSIKLTLLYNYQTKHILVGADQSVCVWNSRKCKFRDCVTLVDPIDSKN